jgi:large subunit ribosomal protein L17
MVTSLFRHERIRTTKAKALEIRRTAEKMITRAKDDTVSNRRIVSSRLYDEGIVAKLFTNIAPRMKERPGGYTRILKLGLRQGDAAEVVILELVDHKLDLDSDKKKAKKKEAKPKDGDKGK